MVAYGGGHITMICLIADRLRRDEWEVDILPLATAIPFCVQSNQSGVLVLSDYVDMLHPTDNELQYVELMLSDTTFHSEIPLLESKAYYTIGFICNLRSKGVERTTKSFYALGRMSFNPILFAEEFIKMGSYSALFATNVPRYERAFIRAGNSLGLSTYAIDDLIGLPLEPIEAKVCFVDNRIAYDNIKKNFSGDLVLSGNPVFDRAKALSRLRINQKSRKELVVLCQTGIRNLETNQIIQLNAEFYQAFIRNLLRDPFFLDFEIVIRLHPSMTDFIYEDERVTFDKSLFIECLKNYEYFIGFTSTALYEAKVSSGKVIALNFGRGYFQLPISYSGRIDFKGTYKKDSNIKFSQASNKDISESSLNIIAEKLKK